jgi:hypothetical protein
MRFAGSQLSNFIDGTNFDNIGKAGITSRANENNARMVSDAYVEQADINADATVKAAKFGASATKAQGAAAGQSAMFSGLGSMASGIAGGFASRPEVKAPQPTSLEAFDAGTFFANSFLNR